MAHFRPIRCAVAAIAAALLLSSPVWGQSGPGLLMRPWQGEDRLELSADALWQSESETDDAADADLSLSWYDAAGRYRFDPEAEHSVAAGFDLTHLDLDTNHPNLPERLSDQSLALGVPLGETEGGWKIGFTAGLGFAGDTPYADEDAWYAKATLIGTRQITEDKSWLLFLNYDGNRTFLPDVPIPGAAFSHRVSDSFRYTVGLPYSEVHWRPAQRLSLHARYAIPYTVNARVDYMLLEKVGVFARLENRFDAYHIEGADEHRRLFFEQRRIEGGLRWGGRDRARLELAGGLAFDQEFSTGYDARDLNNDIEVESAPYVRLGLGLRF